MQSPEDIEKAKSLKYINELPNDIVHAVNKENGVEENIVVKHYLSARHFRYMKMMENKILKNLEYNTDSMSFNEFAAFIDSNL